MVWHLIDTKHMREQASRAECNPNEIIKIRQKDMLALLDEIDRLRAHLCSCPSGDGSLRWPCKAHPPEKTP